MYDFFEEREYLCTIYALVSEWVGSNYASKVMHDFEEKEIYVHKRQINLKPNKNLKNENKKAKKRKMCFELVYSIISNDGNSYISYL
jgi:hypothetical protein